MGVFGWSLVDLFGILPVTAYPDPFGVRDPSVHICMWFGRVSSNSGTNDFNLNRLLFPLLELSNEVLLSIVEMVHGGELYRVKL